MTQAVTLLDGKCKGWRQGGTEDPTQPVGSARLPPGDLRMKQLGQPRGRRSLAEGTEDKGQGLQQSHS